MSKIHAQKVWSSLLSHIQVNNLIAPASFENWFSSTKALTMSQTKILIFAPDEFTKDWLESKYNQLISQIYFELFGENIIFEFSTIDETQEDIKPSDETSKSLQSSSNFVQQSSLIKEYTFDNFIVGDSNRLAYNVMLAAAEDPAAKYNPIFIYGNTGLGKTHLLHSIGNYLKTQQPNKKVLYITSDDFINDFMHFIRDKNEYEFKSKYREIDVLMIDDIQFLAGATGRHRTQNEFFHTFNALHQINKQIIIASDTHPNQLDTLIDRLKSRFNWGIIIDILPPDLETRIAILQKKVKMNNLDEEIPPQVIEFLANQFDANIRELEGGLRRLIAYAAMTSRKEIDLELAMEALNGFSNKSSKTITTHKIQKTICDYFKINKSDLISKTKQQPLTQYRHISIYLTKKHTTLSLHKIGKEYGNRDHSTILNSYNKISKDIKSDINLKLVVDELEKKLT